MWHDRRNGQRSPAQQVLGEGEREREIGWLRHDVFIFFTRALSARVLPFGYDVNGIGTGSGGTPEAPRIG